MTHPSQGGPGFRISSRALASGLTKSHGVKSVSANTQNSAASTPYFTAISPIPLSAYTTGPTGFDSPNHVLRTFIASLLRDFDLASSLIISAHRTLFRLLTFPRRFSPIGG